jgi:hypothetical protein
LVVVAHVIRAFFLVFVVEASASSTSAFAARATPISALFAHDRVLARERVTIHAVRLIHVPPTTSRDHVVDVFAVSAGAEVRRIHAPPNITLVTYLHSIRDRTHEQLVCSPMSATRLAVDRREAIPFLVLRSFP